MDQGNRAGTGAGRLTENQGAAVENIVEVDEDDLFGLLDVLTSGGWHPSQDRIRLPFAYRGHSAAARDLRTGLVRLRGDSSTAVEPHILRNFRKYAHRDTSPGDSDWNWLSVAQHHGLPTRLLDWSHSPYVALHFATRLPERNDEPGAVWCVDYAAVHELLPEELRSVLEPLGGGLFTTDTLSRAAYSLAEFDRFRGPDGERVPLFFEPPALDERIVNQAAIFSTMSGAEAGLDEWLARHPELYRKVIIPAKLKWRVRDHLDQVNVTERVLFPGLDGLSLWLRRYYSQRGKA
ncbi:FRG domain-containing protein [Arthrobacter crystallopoietes BAB-32]|uniref:FRG domain-containing protein n=1 Tax=Arthrobacter crystallopoietes BAB-32 TaxID=1246476 RepID=N1UTF9_9MICC|nr:FRG domain-containing protein [Arthrobacter crystallopoietes BAB-32]